MVKTAFSTIQTERFIVTPSNTIKFLELELMQIIEQIKKTTDPKVLQSLVRKLYIIINSYSLRKDILNLCNNLLNIINKTIFMNINIRKTIIYCKCVPKY